MEQNLTKNSLLWALLPRELLFYIRSYLVILLQEKLVEDEMEKIDIWNGRRSWNDFLSASNHPIWRKIRKEGLIVCLSTYFTELYLQNAKFYDYVTKHLVADPYHQLVINLPKNVKNTDLDSEALSNLKGLFVFFLDIDHFPSIKNVYRVSLSSCRNFQGDLELSNVTCLSINNCSSISSWDSSIFIDTFEELNINGTSLTGDLKDFPNLKLLKVPLFVKLRDGVCKNLTNLHITGGYTPISEPHFYIPSDLPLEVLRCTAFPNICSFDFSRFQQLHTIRIDDYAMTSRVIVDRSQELFLSLSHCPKLRRFGCTNVYVPKDILVTLLPQVTEIMLLDCEFEDEQFYLSEKIKFFAVVGFSLSSIKFLSEKRNLFKVSLGNCPSLDGTIIDMLSHVTRVTLDHNPWVKDISPLATVPMLSLRNCTQIVDFSCLGKHQQYLCLAENNQVRDADLEYFSKVEWLDISSCPLIKDLSPLRDNRVIIARFSRLLIATIHGEKHRVNLSYSSELQKIVVTGKILILNIFQNPLYRQATIIDKQRVTFIDTTEHGY